MKYMYPYLFASVFSLAGVLPISLVATTNSADKELTQEEIKALQKETSNLDQGIYHNEDKFHPGGRRNLVTGFGSHAGSHYVSGHIELSEKEEKRLRSEALYGNAKQWATFLLESIRAPFGNDSITRLYKTHASAAQDSSKKELEAILFEGLKNERLLSFVLGTGVSLGGAAIIQNYSKPLGALVVVAGMLKMFDGWVIASDEEQDIWW